MGLHSDYGSVTSDQYSPWGSVFRLQTSPVQTASLEGGVKGIDAVMKEFHMNGLDSPYDPDEEEVVASRKALTGMGPGSAYLRQKSWPAPDSSPAPRLPRAHPATLTTLTNFADVPPVPVLPDPSSDRWAITEQQMRVLQSLPNAVLYPLLRELENSRARVGGRKQEQEVECRFCKNNGERESYYRSHALRAHGRVTCPVLRAFVCRRCGARGDRAHTLKYCPFTTAEERSKSAAMMRSLRTAASCRRRPPPSSDLHDYIMFGETTPSVIADGNVYTNYEPLDPTWAALEQKLML